MPDLVKSLALAFARQEGWYDPDVTLAQQNNNPGNLRTWGTRPIRNGYAYFDTPEAGWTALEGQMRAMIKRPLNLYEALAGQRDSKGQLLPGGYPGYAPAADGNYPRTYATNVASWTGLDPQRLLSSYSGPGAPLILPYSRAKGPAGRAGASSPAPGGATGNPPEPAGENEALPAGVAWPFDFDFSGLWAEAPADDGGVVVDTASGASGGWSGLLNRSVRVPVVGELPVWQAGLVGVAAGVLLLAVLPEE